MTDAAGHNVGTRKMNPFVVGFVTETPCIPGLTDGAEAFGLTGLSASDPSIAAMLTNIPAYAVAAMVRMDAGPAGLGQDWDGFDMLLLVNLTDEALVHPQLGVGREGYVLDLMVGGYARSPLFGGAGYEWLSQLPAGDTYALLVPEGATHLNVLVGGCELSCRETLGCGEAMYMVPEPTTLALLVLGGVGLLARGRRRR